MIEKIAEWFQHNIVKPVHRFLDWVLTKFIEYVIKPLWKVLRPVLAVIVWPIDKLLDQLAKLPSVVIAVLSAILWGFGQLINRQYAKALIFFLFMALVVGAEFASGSYTDEFDLFNDKIAGEDIEEELSNYVATWYYYNLEAVNPTSEYGYTDFEFLHEVAEYNGLTFSEDDLVFYDEGNNVKQVDNLSYSNDALFAFLGAELKRIEDIELENGIEDLEVIAEEQANAQILTIVDGIILEYADRNVLSDPDYTTNIALKAEELAIEALVLAGNNETDPGFDTLLADYISTNQSALNLEAEAALIQEEYVLIYDDEYEAVERQTSQVYFRGFYNTALNNLYGDLVLDYDSIAGFADMLQTRLISPGLNMDNDDYNKMLLRIYFEYDPTLFDEVVEDTNNYFYERTGFFVRGIWGVISLGSIAQKTVYEHQTLGFLLPSSGTQTIEAVSVEIEGHHSTQLLLRGIISTLVLLYVLVIYVWNVRDAYKTSLAIKQTGVTPNEREYFKNLYEEFFEYIVLTPALILVTFISIMPILFGLAVAFTNYNIQHIPPGQLISWVGFENFLEVFNVTSGSGINFGGQFWSVFSWTLIWAVAATFTCFFGGFIQAVIINNKRVVFRKAWRSILILPWAMPALISQMVFRVMFNDVGYVNQVMNRIGVYDLLRNWDMLGRSFQDAGSGLDRLLYFGEENIQWLTNEANPWFVRIFLIVLNIWLGFPFFMALMSGVMTSIDKSLYEAASIDGATGFQQFRFITMPLVLLATSPLLVMTFSGNFNNFGVIYFITGGGPGGGTFETAYAGQTDILISWIYTLTVDANVRWYSMASVFSILIFLIIGSLSAWNFTRTRAFKEDD